MSKKIKISFLLILSICAWLQIGEYAFSRYFPILIGTILISVLKIHKGVKHSRRFDQFAILNLVFILIFISLSFISNSPYEEFIFDVIKVSLAFLSAIWFYYFIENETNQNIHKSIVVISLLSAVIMFIVLLNSYSNFSINLLLANFHQFKTYTIFFVDTNALAIYGLITFSILLYYYRNIRKSKEITLLLFIHFILILACLSRASIIGLFILLLYDKYTISNKRAKTLYVISAILLVTFSLNYLITEIGSDGSGSTKLKIYFSLIDKLPNIDLRGIMFGQGINVGNYTYSYEIGKYSHAFIPMIIGQFGIVGAIIYILYFQYGIYYSKYHTLYIIIPLFVTGLSYLHPFLETIFIGNSIILSLKNRVWNTE